MLIAIRLPADKVMIDAKAALHSSPKMNEAKLITK